MAATLSGGQRVLESEGITVDPHQLLGIEINPRAATIAEMVLWIGYLQWHHRTYGDINPPEPVIKDFHNIECRDAILAYDDKRIVIDPETNTPKTRWNGHTTKPHPITGEEVPDETAREVICEYINPRKAEWPEADYVVGNPPFIGVRRMKDAIGVDYVGALRTVYTDVPDTVDFAMYWWHISAVLAAGYKLRRFGLLSTNSIVQEYSQKVLEHHLQADSEVKLQFAIRDHPWVENADGASVRIAMTVGTSERLFQPPARIGRLAENGRDLIVTDVPSISSNLTSQTLEGAVRPLVANRHMCFQGVVPAGDGFKLSDSQASVFLETLSEKPDVIKPYIIGKDITGVRQTRRIIDFFGISESAARNGYPSLYQHLKTTVHPKRVQNRRKSYAENWWLFAETRPAMRRALKTLERFIVTPYTAKHRMFCFVAGETMPDAMAYAISSDSAFILGVLSASVHSRFAHAAGGRLEDRPRYNSNRTFFPFPFPAATDAQKAGIRELGERLDAHRKARQAEHSKLTMTGRYNVLEKLRSGEALTKKEKAIHEQGLVSVLKEIHDELDEAVFDAYGWPSDLNDEEILERLVALNLERAEEEKRGLIRWLRPDFQNPEGAAPTQTESAAMATATRSSKQKVKKRPWPKGMAAQAQAVRKALAGINAPATVEEVAARFTRARKATVGELLETLATLGQCRQIEDGRFVAQW
jgi:hypothetical protein